MSIFHTNALIGASGSGGAYSISRSLRFNSVDSAYLSRTPASAGNRRTWTWAGWVKLSILADRADVHKHIFQREPAAATFPQIHLRFDRDSDSLFFGEESSGGSYSFQLRTTQVFRDTSAWYHFVISVDTTQATASNRIRFYVNGTQITAFSTASYPTQNFDTCINQAGEALSIGRSKTYGEYFDGYLTEVYFIDGQALDPTSFGEFDLNGIWQPKLYTGTYGTNGFKLNFADNSSNTATTLGKDTSGNGNNWTPNNLSVTAGAGNDSLVDSPTNYGTDTGVGGEVRGNYCTFNPLSNTTTLSNGNLDSSNVSSSDSNVRATIGISSGKWYWEITNTTAGISGSQATQIGISTSTGSLSSYVGSHPGGYAVDTQNGNKYNNTSAGSYFTGASAVNSVHGVAFDADNGTITFYRNGTTPGVAYSSIPSGTYFPAVSNYASSCVANFGQRPFAYTAPSGFKALCTANLPAPVVTKPSSVFDVVTYTGTGSTQTIGNLGFSPDLVWIKNRSSSLYWNVLFDIVRGSGNQLSSNQTDAELASASNVAGKVSSFNANGFTLEAGSSSILSVAGNGVPYVAWTWDAGSSTVTNTAGSITSQVRANASAGFSIVTYTGNGSNATVGHGLGVSPELIIVKKRSSSENWLVYFKGFTSNEYLYLNSTNAKASFSGTWGSLPTSSVFGVFDQSVNLSTATFVAYCFAPVVGYSSFGSYVGNGSADGPFVFTGFRIKCLWIKETSGTGNWLVWDVARSSFNVMDDVLLPNSSSAEITDPSIYIDVVSNGFKIRSTSDDYNGNSGTYIYCAWAESPFQYARAR